MANEPIRRGKHEAPPAFLQASFYGQGEHYRYLKPEEGQAWWTHICGHHFRLREEEWEFKKTLSDIVASWPAWCIEQDPVSRQQQQQRHKQTKTVPSPKARKSRTQNKAANGRWSRMSCRNKLLHSSPPHPVTLFTLAAPSRLFCKTHGDYREKGGSPVSLL